MRMRKVFSLLLALTMALALLPVTALAEEADTDYPIIENIYNNFNGSRVSYGPTAPTVFTPSQNCKVVSITNYHYGYRDGLGTIGIREEDTVICEAQAVLTDPSGYWTAFVNAHLEAGHTYTVFDSEASTWSYNRNSGNAGFTYINSSATVKMYYDGLVTDHTVTFDGNGHTDAPLLVLNVPNGQSIADALEARGDEDGWGKILVEVTDNGKKYFVDDYAWDPEGTQLLTEEDWTAQVERDLTVYAYWLDNCIEEVEITVTPPVEGTVVDTPSTEKGWDFQAQEAKPVVTAPEGASYCIDVAYYHNGLEDGRLLGLEDTTMEAGESYQLIIAPLADNDAFFSRDVKVTVNGAQMGDVYYMNSHYLNVMAAVTAVAAAPEQTMLLRVKWSNGATGTVSYGFGAEEMQTVNKPQDGSSDREEILISIPDGAEKLYLKAAPGEGYFINRIFSNDGSATYDDGADFADALLSEDGAACYTVENAILDIEFDNHDGSGGPDDPEPQPTPTQPVGPRPYIPWITPKPSKPSAPTTPAEPAGSELPFTDVDPLDNIYDYIRFVYNEGLMAGVSDTVFDLNGTLTRGMIVTVLWRLGGSPEIPYSGRFSDVAENGWFSPGIEWAASVGIAAGYPDGSFRPNEAVTREQLAAFLFRYVNYKGYTVMEKDLDIDDSDKISGYAVDAVKWAVENDILWVSNMKLRPTEQARRWEIAAALYYLIQNVVK